MAKSIHPPLPVDPATSAALDVALHQSALLHAHVNALAVFSEFAGNTISIARAPALWQAASPDAPDLLLTIHPQWWNSINRDERAGNLLQTLTRVTPIRQDGKIERNYLGRTNMRIARG